MRRIRRLKPLLLWCAFAIGYALGYAMRTPTLLALRAKLTWHRFRQRPERKKRLNEAYGKFGRDI